MVHSEVEYPCPSPAVNRWFLLRITPLAGDMTGAVMSHVNITRRKMAEQELAHEAAHDPLTGLANRGLFADRLTAALTGRRSQVTATQVGTDSGGASFSDTSLMSYTSVLTQQGIGSYTQGTGWTLTSTPVIVSDPPSEIGFVAALIVRLGFCVCSIS